MLHESHPHLREVYLRSDNAGCYHCTPLLACLWKLRNELFVTIREYDFSEAQSGKDLCDLRTGSGRMHILNYINEGNNVTNVFEMKDALEIHGGGRNTFTSIIDVDMSTQPVLSGQFQIHISQYNNFTFIDSGILAFKYYGFGEQLIPCEKLESVTKNMVDMQEAMIVANPKPPTDKPRQKKTTSRLLSWCDPDCVKEFRKESQLLNHILDTSKRMWVQTCTKIRSTQLSVSIETVL